MLNPAAYPAKVRAAWRNVFPSTPGALGAACRIENQMTKSGGRSNAVRWRRIGCRGVAERALASAGARDGSPPGPLPVEGERTRRRRNTAPSASAATDQATAPLHPLRRVTQPALGSDVIIPSAEAFPLPQRGEGKGETNEAQPTHTAAPLTFNTTSWPQRTRRASNELASAGDRVLDARSRPAPSDSAAVNSLSSPATCRLAAALHDFVRCGPRRRRSYRARLHSRQRLAARAR